MRAFFIFLASLTLAVSSIAQINPRNRDNSDLYPFYHGVASGDPLANAVILWTRVTPDSVSTDSVEVFWRIATDTAMSNIINSGTVYTDLSKDFTVKVDATGLNPKTCYYYDFKALDIRSIRGRTITAPEGDVDSLRFAVVSCSNYEHGYFNAYRKITQRNDIDAVIHLGDYIYEYETGAYSANLSGRDQQPTNEIITLDDYRVRYSHYRLDNDLMRLHQQYPFITIWDDHESANDSYVDGAENHDPGTEGSWYDRKSNAKRSYFEWMPMREKGGADSSIYRKFSYGDLFNLYMLDTRLEGRVEQVDATSGLLSDPSRTLLGATQYNWLVNELTTSTAQWNIIGQQVMIAPLEIAGFAANTDQWDGYPVERDSLLSSVMDNNVENLVVLTGDIHTSWANDIPLDGYNSSTGANSAGVEYVVTSVTSEGFPFGVGTSVIQFANPHMKWINLTEHGYLILDINKQRTQGDWYFVETVDTVTEIETLGNAYYVNSGERFLRQASLASASNGSHCMPAPLNANQTLTSIKSNEKGHLALFGAYPNPAQTNVTIQFSNGNEDQAIHLRVIDITGRIVYEEQGLKFGTGVNYIYMDITDLATGSYYITMQQDNEVRSRLLIKN